MGVPLTHSENTYSTNLTRSELLEVPSKGVRQWRTPVQMSICCESGEVTDREYTLETPVNGAEYIKWRTIIGLPPLYTQSIFFIGDIIDIHCKAQIRIQIIAGE